MGRSEGRRLQTVEKRSACCSLKLECKAHGARDALDDEGKVLFTMR